MSAEISAEELEFEETQDRLERLERDYNNLANVFKEMAVELAKHGITLNIPQVKCGSIGGTTH